MKLLFQSINTYSDLSEISFSSEAICLIGEVLDERGEAALTHLNNLRLPLKTISYNDVSFMIHFDNSEFHPIDFVDFFSNLEYEHLIIEATTLGFAEILFALQGANYSKTLKSIKIFYIEPEEYKLKNSSISNYEDFDLSNKLKEFPPIPGFTLLTKPTENEGVDLIAFLGFERKRLGQIFSREEGAPYSKFTPIIPLPAFSPGWENRSINNHLSFFTEEYNFEKIRFVSANNPYQAYDLLLQLSKSRKKFKIAPIGTKPNAIGCAIFLVNVENITDFSIGVLYDFPEKKAGRSTGIGKINIYNLVKE